MEIKRAADPHPKADSPDEYHPSSILIYAPHRNYVLGKIEDRGRKAEDGRQILKSELLTYFDKLVFSASEAYFFSVLDLPFAVEVGVFGDFI